MSWFRTVGARLSLALLVVVAGVLAFVYLIVVPSLENRLVDSRRTRRRRVATSVAAHAGEQQDTLSKTTSRCGSASATNTRVTIFDVANRSPLAR